MAKILIVDDSSFMRKVIGSIIRQAGHIVIGEASDGNEALTKYAQLKPELVIMDITMNNVTGLEGLRRIKIFDPMAKVIMCSAMGQQSMIEEALEEALDFIIKPFKKDEVINAINKALIS
ncbi:MAG: response regulator [Clostridia bacterium]|nr:response regulator [Clostridia bacterium]